GAAPAGLYAWARRDAQGTARPLHVEQALACIDWTQGPVAPIRVEDFRREPSGPLRRQRLVECRYFELDFFRSGEAFYLGGEGRAPGVVLLRGAAPLREPDARAG